MANEVGKKGSMHLLFLGVVCDCDLPLLVHGASQIHVLSCKKCMELLYGSGGLV